MRATSLCRLLFGAGLFLASLVRPATAAEGTPTPAVYPVQEQFVDANGVLPYTKSIGRGAPLVIVHGGPGASHDYLLPYLLPLARHNRLVFIDERGAPALSRDMHARIPGSKLVVLPSSGHMTFVDQPALFNRAVDEFLAASGG